MSFFMDNDVQSTALKIALAGAVVAGGVAWSLTQTPEPNKLKNVDYDNQSIIVDEENCIRGSQLFSTSHIERGQCKNIQTLYDIFQCGLIHGELEPCIGFKSKQSDGSYQWLTYAEVNANAIRTGSGIVHRLKQAPGQQTRIGIFMKNSLEWVYVEQACTRYSMVLVPLYDTLGEEACRYILNHVTCEVLFVDSMKKIEFLINNQADLPNLKYIVATCEFDEETRNNALKLGLQFVAFTDLLDIGSKNPRPMMIPKPEDTSTILFTSGTTGIPKGCVIAHGAFIASISSAAAFYDAVNFGKKKEVHLSFLPLTHIYERLVHALMFLCSGKIFIFSGEIREIGDEMKRVKPTILFAVPRILNRVYAKVTSTVNKSRGTKFLYDMAFASKMKEVQKGIIRRNSIWDYLIFRKVQAFLGGNIEMVIVGSAPVTADVLNFFRTVMGCLVIEGYGQSETTGPVTMTFPGESETDHVGAPVSGMLIKLCDVPELDIIVSRDQRGEICVKGRNCIKEYFNDAEMSKQLIDSDGWLHTGDIGLWTKKGQLKIVDRCKHIFKLSQGEYLAPERLENFYSLSSLVAQIFVTGSSIRDFCVAIVVPDIDGWKALNNKYDSITDICMDKQAVEILLNDLQTVGRKHKLNGFEIIRRVHLHPTMMTPENGLLTPTLKLKRKEATNYFTEEIEALYL